MSWTLEGEMIEFADVADELYEKLLLLSDFPTFGVKNYRLIGLPFYDSAPTSYKVGLESSALGDFRFPGACLVGGSQWEVLKTLITPVQDHFSHWLVSQGGGGTRSQNVAGAITPPNNVSLSCIRSDGVEVLNPPPLALVLANMPQADDESPYSWSFYRYGFPPLTDPAIPGLVTCNA